MGYTDSTGADPGHSLTSHRAMTYTLLLRTQHGWTDNCHGMIATFNTEERALAAAHELGCEPGEFKVVPTEDLGNYDLIG